ncbi:MAG: TonB-dependent receptor plug domain-containing protein, partial [Paludibacter sp.]|nr:TonB-dependent receptor plug domain-containing protein [Paludibacter sp.]
DENGREKRVDLPAPEAVGVALQLTYNRGKINLKITNNTSLPADSLYLMAHSRGEVLLLSPLNNYTGQLSEHLLPAGIISFSILDAAERVWCERIYFSRTFADPTISMIADRSEYLSREPVLLNFHIQKPDSTPLPANFSLSVTDSYHVQKDTLNNDIRSYLLLSSDLKGYVEAPQEYFADNSLQTREKTDLLMLTQGWRRFNTADIVKGNYPKNDYFLEAGQALTGKVLNLFNKPVRNSTVVSMNRYDNKVKITTTDSLGRYYIDGIEFPDSTSITLKATTRSRIADVEIVPDSDFFPTPPRHLPKQLVNKESISDEYLRVSREKYYNDGGMMVINLDEITVSASTVKKDDGRDFYYSGMADSEINAERLAKFPTMRLIDVLATVPGVMVFGDNIRIRGAMESPTFMIDGMEAIDSNEISYLSAADVEEVQVFKGSSAAIFGVRGANGVIAITLKKGITPNSITSPSIAHIKPLGFHVPDAFYVPRYEVDSIRQQKKVDLRTTIYWNPDVETDADGRAVVTFYTADNPNNYRIELEGIAADGSICRYRGELKRR